MRVSFDFDMTLDRPHVQEYARELIEKGIEVWIHTLRVDDKKEDYATDWNDDLYAIAYGLGITKDRIVFCNMIDKWNFLEGFTWHIDDDSIECDLINKHTKCVGICHYGNSTWKNKCNKLLWKSNL